MVANEPDVSTPLHNRVVGREVINPQERLTTQLNGIRHKVEHRNPDRHLYEHRQTSAQRTYAVFRIELHHSLLLLHSIFGLIELLCCLIKFRTKNTHLGTRHITLLHHRESDGFQQKSDKYEDVTHRYRHLPEEVEDVEREPAVDNAEQRPSEINETLQFQFLTEGAFFLNRLQEAEIIWTIVELKLCGLYAGRVEGCLQLCLIILQVACSLLLRHAGKFYVRAIAVLGNHYG